MTITITSTHSADDDKRIGELVKELSDRFEDEIALIPTFESNEDPFIETLTFEQAVEIARKARRMLVVQLLAQETHEHWHDDCGDYQWAALENWQRLFESYFRVADDAAFVEEVKSWLKESPEEWLASDGEVRFNLFSEDYIERSWR